MKEHTETDTTPSIDQQNTSVALLLALFTLDTHDKHEWITSMGRVWSLVETERKLDEYTWHWHQIRTQVWSERNIVEPRDNRPCTSDDHTPGQTGGSDPVPYNKWVNIIWGRPCRPGHMWLIRGDRQWIIGEKTTDFQQKTGDIPEKTGYFSEKNVGTLERLELFRKLQKYLYLQ